MEIHPQVARFIRFCVQRRGDEWPALYDEMCRVAGRGTFEGLRHSDLINLGLSLGLDGLQKTIKMVDAVTGNKL